MDSPFSLTELKNGDDDNDGMDNWYEESYTDIFEGLTAEQGLWGLNKNDASDASKDFDNDGLTNLQEYHLKTRPYVADHDGDGFTNFEEKRQGTDPLNISIWLDILLRH